MESMEGSLYLIVAIVAVLFVTFAAILSRYKRCPCMDGPVRMRPGE